MRTMSEETRRKISERMRGHVVLEATRQKIRLSKLGVKQSAETIAKRSAAMIGNTNRCGCTHVVSAETRAKISKSRKGIIASEETRRKISEANRRRFATPESRAKASALHKARNWKPTQDQREKQSAAQLGHKRMVGFKHSEVARREMSKGQLSRSWTIEERHRHGDTYRGKNNVNWKGGVTPKNKAIRHSLDYKLWRDAVFKRDNFTCQSCGQRGGVLNADHIRPFARFEALRFDVDNGRTLCVTCHRSTETFGVKSKRT